MVRCINLDWLEVFAAEDKTQPRDVVYYQKLGYQVQDRGYGTRMYAEMFTIFEEGIPVIEIRRKPLSSKDEGGIFEKNACHLRLTNRSCYIDHPINFLRQFMIRHGYEFRGISRVDICLDFHRFDMGDDPAVVIRRYIEGKYSKINQSVAKARWEDTWGDRVVTWVSWGLPSSMVSTKIYLKSRELKNVGDKPWIRQAWQQSGLIDDMDNVDKDIWRVEFSVKAGSAKWVTMPGYNNGKDVLPNTLDQYQDRQRLLYVFASLADHYFHFKHVERQEDGKLRRKDRCKDKVLFSIRLDDQVYKLTRLTKAVPITAKIMYLLKNLKSYRTSVYNQVIRHSFDVTIDWIQARLRGEQKSIEEKHLLNLFEQAYKDPISGKIDMPFFGDDLQAFILQERFRDNFYKNNNKN